MSFPFFRSGDTEPTFRDVEVGPNGEQEGSVSYFPDRYHLVVAEDDASARVETYKRMSIVHNDWTHFAFVIPGAEGDALSWFRKRVGR